jgi:small subunit ribosomal protein S20
LSGSPDRVVRAVIHTTAAEDAVPRTKSAKKHERQTKSRTAANRAQRSRIRSAVKAVRAAQTAEDKLAALKTAESLLDRAGRKLQIHPNTAARTKRRLAKVAKAK